MRGLLRALGAQFKIALATMVQYRGEIVLWAVWGVVYPAVAMAMWIAARAESVDSGGLAAFERGQIAAYFLLTMIVGHVCTAWDVYEMGHLVRPGAMSAKLLRPWLPIWERLADNVAYKVLTLVILVPIWAGVAWASRPDFATTRADLLMAVPALLLAAGLSFLWCHILGLLAFWVTRMDAIGEMWFWAGLFLGGRLAPMSFLPGPLQMLAAVLPFKWMVWFPTEVLMGRVAPGAIGFGLLMQTAWLLIGLAAFRGLWRVGVKRYAAVGA